MTITMCAARSIKQEKEY